tara:strand:+ start:43 stop:642 length:600 start_codon:yes stop_codon:yes gene_type:complete
MTLTLNGNTNTISGLAVGGLPDGIVDNDTLANSVNTVTHYDCWRLTDNTTDEDEDPVGSVTALERAIDANGDRPGYGTFGTPMTNSSGIFSFPVTGYWKVEFQSGVICADANSNHDAKIAVTTDGGTSWNSLSRSQGSINDDGGNNVYNTNYCSLVVDVTNTTNVKVKFQFYNEDADATILGEPTYNRTCMMFTRIGAT